MRTRMASAVAAFTLVAGLTGFRAASPTMFAGCVFQYNVSGHCAGMLPAGFDKLPDPANVLDAAFKEATKNWKLAGGEAYRHTTPKCPSGPADCQFATTYYNTDSRGFDLTKLGDDPIVVGGMRWRPDDQYADSVYKAGGNLSNDIANRTTVMVAYKFSDPKDPRAMAKWKLYSRVRGSNAITEVSSGTVHECEKNHPIDGAYSGFLGCPARLTVTRIAQQSNVPEVDLLAALHCEPGLLPRGASVATGCAAQQRARIQALFPVRNRTAAVTGFVRDLQKIMDDETDNTYWFSCLLGCCTADGI